MAENTETVTISKERYQELLKDESWLAALEAAGVDNWSGYDEAREIQREWEEEDED
ncbi:hypothetical protein ACT414_18885 (plasmid) [Acinetobacter baumannii]